MRVIGFKIEKSLGTSFYLPKGIEGLKRTTEGGGKEGGEKGRNWESTLLENLRFCLGGSYREREEGQGMTRARRVMKILRKIQNQSWAKKIRSTEEGRDTGRKEGRGISRPFARKIQRCTSL